MKQIFTIFRFTIINAAKKKAFIISTFIMILLIGVVTALPALATLLSTGGTTETQVKQICYYIDDSDLIADAIPTLTEHFETTEFIDGSTLQLGDYSNEIQNNSHTSIIVVTSENNQPFIKVITKDFRSGLSASRVVDVLSYAYVAETLAAQGISAETIAATQSILPFSSETLNKNDIGEYFIGILVTMLVFLAVYFYSYSVAMSVASDKTSRVMEIIVVATKPSHILIGKCLAMGTLGLAQFFVLIASGLVFYKALTPGEFVLFEMTVDMSIFTLQNTSLLVLYFILGYALYAMMNAVCGALVSKVEDLNSAMMPITLITLAAFYVGFFSATSNADGIIQKIALYAPFSSPFYVPSRLLSGELTVTQISISMGILLITIAAITILSIRIYSATVLSYGKGLKIKDIVSSIK